MRSIQDIDRDIDANRAELRRRETTLIRGHALDPVRWQIAWDRHPHLYCQERSLFRERGQAQLIRDLKADGSRSAKRQLRDLLGEMA